MESSRQQTFLKLRPPCVELSSVGLKFRGNLANPRDVLRAVEVVHGVLTEVISKNGLDEKLAEYAFFPLSHIFNETQRLPVRCLELAVLCLQILIEKGWRQKLSPQLGKQLLILLTILAGGTPGQSQAQGQSKPQSEELAVAAFNCIGSLCTMLVGPEASSTIYNELGSSTIVDQTVYVLLEGITDGSSDGVQLAAVSALQALNARISDRVVLASLLPRTVSALTKTLRPTTNMRRSYKVLRCCLELLTDVLKATLNDADVAAKKDSNGSQKRKSSDTPILDDSWLKATASQVKLALANVIRLRGHDRPDVRHAILQLSLMVIEDCPRSLADSEPMMVETVVALASIDEQLDGGDAYTALKHLAVSSSSVCDILKSSLHTWIVALPRVMHSNDDSAKQKAMKQISTAFQVLSETQGVSEILDETMATSLCDTVSATIQTSSNAPQPLPASASSDLELSLHDASEPASFQPVLLERGPDRQTLSELKSMIAKLNSTDSSLSMAKSMLKRMDRASGNAVVAPFWLVLSFLSGPSSGGISWGDMLDIESLPSRPALIEDLYAFSIPHLTDLTTANPPDWRVSALSLEGIALQAQQLGEAFRPELIDALYPVLQLMGSSNTNLQHHAMACLNILTKSCGYLDTSTMLVDNVDYLVNSVALKLNTFDISPQAPQVLLMMVRLCGASLIPYLDDLIGSIFAALDAFHGYPKLVELLFSVLGTIVEEGAKKPELLAITAGEEKAVNHRKRPFASLTVSELADHLKKRTEKRAHSSLYEDEFSTPPSHPKEPWTSEFEKHLPTDEDENQGSEPDEGSPPPTKEDETKPLSKTHNLLLNIVKSIPPHLSSPSPFLRRSLLSIISRAMPILAHDENTFLPLINDLWPSVSARITVPPSNPSDSTSLMTVGPSKPPSQYTTTNIDEQGVQEETYIIVACCDTIRTMCEGAGDFMSSRIQREIPRWKKLYLRCWERVRHDSEKVTERQQQRSRQRERLKEHTISDLQSLTLKNTEPKRNQSSTAVSSSIPMDAPTRKPGLLPPPFPDPKKFFTPHHSIWQALTRLFTTILSHVRLPDDVLDELCECLGPCTSFYYPDYYFSYAWCLDATDNNTRFPDTEAADRDQIGHSQAVTSVIRAMDTYNADLTWFIFDKERRRNTASSRYNSSAQGGQNDTQRRKLMDKKLKLLCGMSSHARQARSEDAPSAGVIERWAFAGLAS